MTTVYTTVLSDVNKYTPLSCNLLQSTHDGTHDVYRPLAAKG